MDSTVKTPTQEALEALQKAFADRPKAAPCPSCGHCPTCGRGGYHTNPWYPTYPYQPYWGPYTGVTTQSGLGQANCGSTVTYKQEL